MHLRRREREVPVPRHRFWRRERGVAIIYCCDSERDVAAEDDRREPQGEMAHVCQSRRQTYHQRLVGHWVYYAANNALLIPSASYPAIEKISDPGVAEEQHSWVVLAMEYEVAYRGRGKKAAKG